MRTKADSVLVCAYRWSKRGAKAESLRCSWPKEAGFADLPSVFRVRSHCRNGLYCAVSFVFYHVVNIAVLLITAGTKPDVSPCREWPLLAQHLVFDGTLGETDYLLTGHLFVAFSGVEDAHMCPELKVFTVLILSCFPGRSVGAAAALPPCKLRTWNQYFFFLRSLTHKALGLIPGTKKKKTSPESDTHSVRNFCSEL